MKRNSLLLILLFGAFHLAFGQQEFDWWYRHHNLTDSLNWKRYITISPGYFGPNALPVPDVQNGLIKEDLIMDFSVDAHFLKGDNTQNLYNQLYLPFAKNNAAFHFYSFGLEHFNMSPEIRDERMARDSIAKGWSGGDIYCGTIFQIFKDFYKLPDVTISYYFKFPCGENYRNARFTDAGTYFFDIAFGKNIEFEKFFSSFRPYGMFGFYGYQTSSNVHFQNDAILFGIGLDASINKISISTSYGGYRGYLDNLDKPLVFRASLTKNNKIVDYRFYYQKGIKSLYYNSFRVSAIVHFNREKLKFPFTQPIDK